MSQMIKCSLGGSKLAQMGSHFSATLWLHELDSIGTKKLSKIATTLNFFPVKAENMYFSNLKKGAFSQLYLVLKYKICI